MEAHSYRSLSKKRTTNFREDETKVLIQLWGSPQIQNKLYLTHRKEPVMRLLAANMQQRGFYRTPDEIKTRIRNLKCLYHRIKRSLQSGAGIGTVDPDWPHYKAMDNILTRQSQKKENLYKDNVFEGPRCEDIKQEIDDIDINDDMESYTTNSMAGSEYEEEPINLPPLTPAPGNKETAKKANEKTNVYHQHQVKPLPKILPLPAQSHHQVINNGQKQAGQLSSLPFPLLILNGLPTQPNTEKKEEFKISSHPKPESDINGILRELVEIQKENLDVEKQRLELDKQKFEFERFIGTQLLAFGPVFTGILQRCAFPQDAAAAAASEDFQGKNNNTQSRKRSATASDLEILKDSKILKTILTQSIRKYMMGEEISDDDNDDNSKGSDK